MRESSASLAGLAGALALVLAMGAEAAVCFLPQAQPPPAAPSKPPEAKETTEARPTPDKPATPSGTAAAAPATEEDQFFVELKYGVNGTDLKGNKERSFLNEGVNHISDLSTFMTRGWGIRRLETLSIFRYTDDPRVDPERNSLQRTYARLTGPGFELAWGDHLVSYSRFTFNQNIKGLNARKDFELPWPWLGTLRLIGTGGVFTDRWGALFRDPGVFTDPRRTPDPRFPSKPYTRVVLGGRAEYKLEDSVTLAFSYSQGSDVIRSLPREAQISPVNNQVFGIDTTILLGRNFRLAGEVAYSLTQFDARFQPDKRRDYGLRGELSHRWRGFSWRAEYTLFMPNFFSVNARQVQDLQDGSLRATLDLSRFVSLQAAYRRTNDNLPGQPVLVLAPDPVSGELRPRLLTNGGRSILCPATAISSGSSFCQAQGPLFQETLFLFGKIVDIAGNTMTTVLALPEARLTLRGLPGPRRWQVNLGYRERAFSTSNDGQFDITTQRLPGTSTDIVVKTPLFRERVTKIPFLDFTFSMPSGALTFGYEYRRNRDRVRRDNSTFTHRVAGGYSGTWYLGRWGVSPRVRYEAERASKQVGLEPVDDPVTQNRLLDPASNLPLVATFSGGDLTRSIQGSFTIDFPKYFSLEAHYRGLSGELLTGFASGNFFSLSSGGFSQIAFGNGGYRRPSFRAQLTFRIANDENRFITFVFERSVNTFSLPDPREADTKSFRENVAQVSLVWRFRRQ